MIALRALPFLSVLLLSGCAGALLGPGHPASLYRLEGGPLPTAAAPGPTVHATTMLLTVRFAPEIDDDRLLTVRGRQAMYIKDVRWVATGPDLFAAAVSHALSRRAPAILVATPRQAPGGADYALQIAVDRFEAVYAEDAAGDTPPAVQVRGEARLLRPDDRHPIATWPLDAHAAAAENRVGSIVAAFDAAIGPCLDRLAGQVATAIARDSPSPSRGDNDAHR